MRPAVRVAFLLALALAASVLATWAKSDPPVAAGGAQHAVPLHLDRGLG